MLHIVAPQALKYKIYGLLSLIITFFFTKEILYDIVDIC
jgi:hypothetical protein